MKSDSGVFAASFSTSRAAGNGGNISFSSESLDLSSGGRIDSESAGGGNGGDIKVSVHGKALLSGLDVGGDGGDLATADPRATGNAGGI